MVDLQRRESELQRREADLARRETSLAAAGAVQKNWPRYLRWVHHDINGDIPAARRGLVRAGYTAWCLVACGYVYNFICITAFFIGGQKKVSLWVFSGLVAVAGELIDYKLDRVAISFFLYRSVVSDFDKSLK